MKLIPKKRKAIDIFEIDGKFDIEETNSFDSQIDKIVGSNPQLIGLDFKNLSYVDSAAIGSLIKTNNLIKSYGGELIIFGLNEATTKIFDQANLNQVLQILSDDEFTKRFPEE